MIIELRAKKLIGMPMGNHCSNVNERTDRKKKCIMKFINAPLIGIL